jgi:hypothetical protein
MNQIKWISIKDQFPDEHKEVLYYSLEQGIELGFYNPSQTQRGRLKDITHWMPLPEEPEET